MFRRIAVMTIAVLLITAGPALANDRDPSPSRGQSNRWLDSGVSRVWNHAPQWIRDLGLCVRKHESIRVGHYTANNPSGASGAYQFMPSTWRGNARYTPGAQQYANSRPSSAPPWVQDAVFVHAIQQGGIHAWHGTWCPGT